MKQNKSTLTESILFSDNKFPRYRTFAALANNLLLRLDVFFIMKLAIPNMNKSKNTIKSNCHRYGNQRNTWQLVNMLEEVGSAPKTVFTRKKSYKQAWERNGLSNVLMYVRFAYMIIILGVYSAVNSCSWMTRTSFCFTLANGY